MELQELNLMINQELITVGITIVILIFFGTGIIVLLLRPLAGQVIIQTDELERQNREKTQALQELNQTQEQLKQEIDERKKIEKQLQQSTDNLKNQNKNLLNLTKNKAIHQGDFLTAIQVITEATAFTMNTARVSFWLYNQEKQYMICEDLFEKNANQHSQGIQLNYLDYPAYFQALENNDIIVASDAHTDPITYEFSEYYLSPLGIASMLDSPIRIGGATIGILCIEHIGEIRYWGLEDENFARSIADLISIAIEARDRQQAESALRKSEAELREQKNQLQLTLKELQYAQAQMIQSEKMSSLGQMVAGVAHEINNPVNFIHGNIFYADKYIQDLLKILQLYQKYFPHPPQEILDEIEAVDLEFLTKDLSKLLSSMQMGTNRIREIVKSLRNFSRFDEAEIKKVNIHEGINSTLMILENRLKAKPERSEINVIKEYEKLPLINCYPGQLNQVFMNILSNAIDAIDECQTHIKKVETQTHPSTIKIKTGLINNDWVEIKISDNGLGINSEICGKLFDPFFTTKPVGSGTGLGLSISYQIIVERHQGKINCHSLPGKGAEFVIQIPIYQKTK